MRNQGWNSSDFFQQHPLFSGIIHILEIPRALFDAGHDFSFAKLARFGQSSGRASSNTFSTTA